VAFFLAAHGVAFAAALLALLHVRRVKFSTGQHPFWGKFLMQFPRICCRLCSPRTSLSASLYNRGTKATLATQLSDRG
jgi:hypothetical protein